MDGSFFTPQKASADENEQDIRFHYIDSDSGYKKQNLFTALSSKGLKKQRPPLGERLLDSLIKINGDRIGISFLSGYSEGINPLTS